MSSGGSLKPIARKIRLTEQLKTDLVRQVSDVFRDIQESNERGMVQSFASLIASTYLLGHEMGLPLSSIDGAMPDVLKRRIESDYLSESEIDPVLQYLNSVR